jgi:hypothetical protein
LFCFKSALLEGLTRPMQDKRKAKSCPRGLNHLSRPPRVTFPPIREEGGYGEWTWEGHRVESSSVTSPQQPLLHAGFVHITSSKGPLECTPWWICSIVKRKSGQPGEGEEQFAQSQLSMKSPIRRVTVRRVSGGTFSTHLSSWSAMFQMMMYHPFWKWDVGYGRDVVHRASSINSTW